MLTFSSKAYDKYEDFLNDFKSLNVDTGQVYEINDLLITKDVGNIALESGKLYVCKQLDGRMCAAVFVGKGNFDFVPTNKVERGQLHRYFDTTEIHKEIKSVFLLFGDSSLYTMLKDFKKSDEEIPDDINSFIKNAIHYSFNKENTIVDSYISETFLDKKINDMFYSDITLSDGKEVFLYIDPYDVEEVNFLKSNWYAGYGKYAESICKFSKQDHNTSLDTIIEQKEIDIYKYSIKCKFGDDIEINCKTQLDFKALQENIGWEEFEIYEKLIVDSVKSKDGKFIPFYKPEKKSSTFWVKLPNGLKLGDSSGIICYYHGQVMTTIGDYQKLEESMGWFPNYGGNYKSFFDITYYYPKRYKLASVGDKVSSDESGEVKTSHWVTCFKIRNASFNLDNFDKKEFEEKDCIPVELLYKNSSMTDFIKDDVMTSLQFYDKLYGKIPAKKIYITERLANYGEAFPGMVHLATWTFVSGENSGVHETFAAHEIAHQWWGIGMEFKTYRDQWLSEAFAEYSALTYLQATYKDKDKFWDLLKIYKKEVIDVRKTFLGKGMEPGPISLGYRTRSSNTPGDYDLIIYKKGAWVLHMLRNMLLDIKTMKEDLFFGIMKDFYNLYKDKYASTQDFINLVSKKAGVDMQWFFDQWVDDIKIPSYHFAYKTKRSEENGKYIIRVRIKQEDVPSEFKMIIPLKIDFGNDKYYRMRVVMTGDKPAEFDLPPMPMEPKKIIFNDLESVLCNVDYDKWE
jgi:hypothetical protein